MYVCKHVPSLYSHGIVHISDVTEQIWLPHHKDEPHNNYAKLAYKPNITASVCQNITKLKDLFQMLLPCMGPAKYVSKCQIYQLLNVHM